jgi:hypothetical protein
MTDTRRVDDQLNAIPPARRRRMALALAPLGLALLVAGVLAVSRDGVGWKLAGLLVAVLAVVLLGLGWGLQHSAALSEAADAEHQLDQVLAAAAGSSGATCGPPRSAGSEGPSCGKAGLVCGSGSADRGCGADCVARIR